MAKNLRVEIIGDAASYAKALNSAAGATTSFGSHVARAAKVAAVALGAAGVGAAILTLKRGFDELEESQQVMAQTNAVLKSTGDVSNVSAKQVGDLATQLSLMSGADDEAVQAGENMLLTFTNIRNEVGKGNDIFNQATKATLDMATAMNRGATPSSEQLAKQAILVGKALNDPVKGMTALRRVGVSFTESQVKQIKTLVETGKTMEAQKLILRELNKEFGGSAKAAGSTLPGQLNKLKNAFDELAGGIVGALVPASSTALTGLTNFIQKLGAAKGFKAKIGVILEPAKDAFVALRDALSRELFGGFSKGGGVGPEGIKFDQGLVTQVRDALANLDWTSVGKSIIDGIVGALRSAGELAKTIANTVLDAVRQINWEQVGRIIGPGLAVAITVAFTTLLDPAFWARNWDLALAVALVAFSGPIGKVAGKLAEPLLRLGGDLVLSIGAGIERAFPRLAEAFVAGVQRIPSLVAAAFSPLSNLVSSLFGKLGGLATFTVKVLGIQAAISAIGNFAQTAINFFTNLGKTIGSSLNSAWETLKNAAARAALAIVEPFSHLPGFLGGWARKAKDAIEGEMGKVTSKPAQQNLQSEGGQMAKVAALLGHKAAEGVDSSKPAMAKAGKEAGNAAAQAVGGAAGTAHAGGVSVGASAAQGVAAGIYAYLPAAIAAGVALVNQTIASMRSAAAAQSPSKKTAELGKDMADGVGVGFTAGIPAAAVRAAASLNTFLQALATKISQSKTALASGFRDLANNILSAFDEVVSNWKPPSQILLEKMQLEDQIRQAVDAIAQAQTAVDQAVAAQQGLTRNEGESDADFAARQAQAEADVQAAVKQLGDAQRAQTELNLQLQAAQEQAAHDKQMAADRENLAGQLLQLQTELAKHPEAYAKIQKQILALLKKYHVPLYQAGQLLASKFNDGLSDGIKEVIATARRLAAALEQIPGVGSPAAGGGGGGGGPSRPPDVPGGRAAAAGTTVNVTVNGDVSGDEIVEKVRRGIQQYSTINGGVDPLAGRA